MRTRRPLFSGIMSSSIIAGAHFISSIVVVVGYILVEIDRITSTLFPSDWFKAHPNYQNYVPLPKEPPSPQIVKRQQEATINWFSIGTCNALSNITQPTLLTVGTDDMWTPAANSLMMAQKIP